MSIFCFSKIRGLANPSARLGATGLVLLTAACATPRRARTTADRAAQSILAEAQQAQFGRADAWNLGPAGQTLRRQLLEGQQLPAGFAGSANRADLPLRAELPEEGPGTVELPPAPWEARIAADPLRISLEEALAIAARNNRDYQNEKERVFLVALDLDLARDEFRSSWTAVLASEASTDGSGEERISGITQQASLTAGQRLKTGAQLSLSLGLDLVRLLTGSESSSMGLFGDASVSVPLLRGAGRFVTTEPLRQAERDVLYALYDFESFRRGFSVRVASAYLSVLEQADRVRNSEENYRGLVASARRARALSDAGRLPEIQVDQAVQDELRARDRWVSAVLAYERQLDQFKSLLGLPPDAAVEVDPAGLATLVAAVPAEGPEVLPGAGAEDADDLLPPGAGEPGPFEIPFDRAIRTAFDSRLDFRVAVGRMDDAQRAIAVAADDLRPDLTLLGRMSVGERRNLGSADRPDARLDLGEGRYTGRLTLDWPLRRTAARNRYRNRWISFERSIRAAEALEDQIKLEVRDRLRTLMDARESLGIQARAVEVARRRVQGAELLLELGRAQIRDLLEARESLISAENALTSARIRYRVAELELQRDLGVLEVTEDLQWQEAALP